MFLSGTEYLAQPRAKQTWLVEDLLPVSGLLNVYGPAKAGKTYAVLDLAIAISSPARGRFMEWDVKSHGPVWYLQIDTPRGVFMERYLEHAITLGHCINGIHFADTLMVEPYPFNIVGEGRAWLQKAIAANPFSPPVALIIDTLRDAHPGDENDSSVMRNVITGFVEAVSKIDPPPALIFLSHEKKLASDQPINLMQGNRGSNYLAGRVDAVMRVAGGEIRAEGRAFEQVVLNDYKRNSMGFWFKFHPDEAVREFLARTWKSANQRNGAFHKAYGVSKNTADNYFKRYAATGHALPPDPDEESE